MKSSAAVEEDLQDTMNGGANLTLSLLLLLLQLRLRSTSLSTVEPSLTLDGTAAEIHLTLYPTL
jgi:hypothetical protein